MKITDLIYIFEKAFKLSKLLLIPFMISYGISAVEAREFRTITPIFGWIPIDIPEGMTPVDNPIPVSQDTVVKAVDKLFDSWNTPQMNKHLKESFYDGDRLQDAVTLSAPHDAKLQVTGVSSPRVLQQWVDDVGDQTSRISVTVRHQVEFNSNGVFQRLEGSADYVLDINHQIINGEDNGQ